MCVYASAPRAIVVETASSAIPHLPKPYASPVPHASHRLAAARSGHDRYEHMNIRPHRQQNW